MYFNDNHFTARKQREIEMKNLDKKIAAAEASIRDLSTFFCSVSPEQTLVELESLRDTLQFDSVAFSAVTKLVVNIRRERYSNKQLTLEAKARWSQIAQVAEEVIAASIQRRNESALLLVTSDAAVLSKSQALMPSSVQPSVGSQQGHAQPELTTPVKPAVLPPALRQGSNSTSSAAMRRILSPTREPDIAEALLAPADEFQSVQGSPQQQYTAAPSDAYVEVPTGGRKSNALPPLSLDRGVSEVRPPSIHSPPKELPNGPMTLTMRALMEQEIRTAEIVFQAKLDDARQQWNMERSQLVEKFERLQQLLAEQAAMEKEELSKSHRAAVGTLRTENESLKSRNHVLQDSVDKLTETMHTLTLRLAESEQRTSLLEKQQRNLHSSLVNVVSSAAVLSGTPTSGSYRRLSAPVVANGSPPRPLLEEWNTVAPPSALREKPVGLLDVKLSADRGAVSPVSITPVLSARSPTDKTSRANSPNSFRSVSPAHDHETH